MGILNNDRKGVTEKESLRFSHGYFIFFSRKARCFFEFSAEIGDIVEPGKKGNFGNGILPRGKQFLGISNPKISEILISKSATQNQGPMRPKLFPPLFAES